jgi:hypothetical protein
MFGVNPVCNFPYESFSFGIMGEFSIRSQYLVTMSYEKSHWKEDQSLTGKMDVAGNTASGGVSLYLYRSFEIETFDLGTGYRFYRGALKGVSGTVGLSFVRANYSVNTVFTDTLFDVTENRMFIDHGTRVLPFAALSYKYQVTRFIALGLQARFRYEEKPTSYIDGMSFTDGPTLHDKDSEMGYFKYTFRGIELHANLLFTFKIREVEE